jgi:2-oxoglutarate ferredoxin oxidoreductase subunit gamma
MQTEFVFAGFGGQGVMFAGQLLAYAAMETGLEVTWIPSYGPEMRGGTANCTVVVSKQPIGAPVVASPEAAVAFNAPSLKKYAPQVKSGGVMLWNATLIPDACTRTDITLLPVPASAIAEQIGALKAMNMVMLGAALAARSVLTLDELIESLRRHTPAKRADLLPLNEAALRAGAEVVEQALVR